MNVLGGENDHYHYYNEVFQLDPDSNSWSNVSQLSMGKVYHGVAVADEKMLEICQ